MAETEETDAPLNGVTDTDINKIVDDVLRSAKHATMEPGEEAKPERYHARAIEQSRAQTPTSTPAVSDDVDEWWFEVLGKRIGPLSVKKIRLLWEDGELTPDTLCWHEGLPKWVSLFQVSELAEALTPKLDSNRVGDAADAFKNASSGEWGSPAGSAMEQANRTKLAATQRPAVLPLSAPVDDERAATYSLPAAPPSRDDDTGETPRKRRGFARSAVSGLVAGVFVTGAIVATRVLWPQGPTSVQPIVINVMPPAPAPVVPAAPAVQAAPAAPKAAVPVKKVETAAAPKPVAEPAKPAQPEKPETVDDSFAKTFSGPDELTIGEVFEVVRAHKPAVDSCVKAQHTADAEAEGRLVMRWKVDTQGRVSDVSGAEDIPLAACLAKEIPGWVFPKHALVLDQVEVPFKY